MYVITCGGSLTPRFMDSEFSETQHASYKKKYPDLVIARGYYRDTGRETSRRFFLCWNKEVLNKISLGRDLGYCHITDAQWDDEIVAMDPDAKGAPD